MYIPEIYESDGTKEIAADLPPHATVAVVGENGEYMRRLRRAGLVPMKQTCMFERAVPESIRFGDEVGAIVAAGGEAEADVAKRLAYLTGLPVYVAFTEPSAVTALTQQCVLGAGNMLLPMRGSVPKGASAVSDLMCADNLAGAFGGICCAALGLFDSAAYLIAVGKKPDKKMHEEALELVWSAIDEAATRGRSDGKLPSILAKISLELSLVGAKHSSSFVRGGADDCARTARMLYLHESRQPLSRGEFAFLCGCTLVEMYREYLGCEAPFTPPPDNNLRAEALCEYLGFDLAAAAKAASSRLRDNSLAQYRIREYRDELDLLACDAEKALGAAKRVYRRMYFDDGFSLSRRICAADIKTVIALAPDTFSVTGSALTLMREAGLLERYLF